MGTIKDASQLVGVVLLLLFWLVVILASCALPVLGCYYLVTH